MGFDLFIHMSFMMCPTSGKPYYFNDEFERKYDMPTIEIPENLRKYLYGRGSHFHVYTKRFIRRGLSEVDVDDFLEKYPSWRKYKNSDSSEENQYWTREDHKNFKNLLRFLANQEVSFTVSWSY